MDNNKSNTSQMKPDGSTFNQPAQIKMKVGKTTYNVNVYFNPNSRETMTDKIIRMLRNEVRNSTKKQNFSEKW